MKLAVLGGGGVRSPYLARSLALAAKDLGIDSLYFMDNNKEKLSIFGEISKKVSLELCHELKFKTTLSVEEAVEGADYIITTIRSGGDLGRIIDESIPLSLNVLGQETTGSGGFTMAMRSIPVLLEYARIIEQKANKNAVTFNFTNPAALVTQTLSYAGVERNFGICDGPSSQIHELKTLLSYGDEVDFSGECFGLNHLSWFKNFKANGRDVSQDILNNPKLFTDTNFRMFDPELIKYFKGSLPNTYLYFFYYREKAVQSILESGTYRSQTIHTINQKILNELRHIDINKDFKKAFGILMSGLLEREKSYMNLESKDEGGHHISAVPDFDQFLNSSDSGGYASVALEYINIVKNGQAKKMIINTKNSNNSLNFLEKDDVIETDVTIHPNGEVVPTIHDDIPESIKSLIISMKNYERLASRAILKKDIKLSKEALMIHPLVQSYSLADSIINQHIDKYKDFLTDWR